MLYIGDCFEENRDAACRIADTLGERGTRVIILQEGKNRAARRTFAQIARRTGGALLPFDISALPQLRGLLAACAVLAVGGMVLLETKQKTLPAATLLLEHLGSGKQIRRG